jgi:hypothetical protein
MIRLCRTLLSIAILISLTNLAFSADDTFGKTHADILKMGRTKWFEFYTGKAGESTLGMCEAERIYGDCLTERNDKLLNKLPAAKQKQMMKLRELSLSFGCSMINVGMVLSGGGTIWQPVEAGIMADFEEALYTLLTKPQTKATKPTSAEDVTRLLDKYRKEIVSRAKEIDEINVGDDLTSKAGLKSLAQAEATFKKALALVAGFESKQKALVLRYFISQAQNGDAMR